MVTFCYITKSKYVKIASEDFEFIFLFYCLMFIILQPCVRVPRLTRCFYWVVRLWLTSRSQTVWPAITWFSIRQHQSLYKPASHVLRSHCSLKTRWVEIFHLLNAHSFRFQPTVNRIPTYIDSNIYPRLGPIFTYLDIAFMLHVYFLGKNFLFFRKHTLALFQVCMVIENILESIMLNKVTFWKFTDYVTISLHTNCIFHALYFR